MKEAQIVLAVTALVLFFLESAEAQIPPAAQVTALKDLTKHWPTLTLAVDVCSTEWLRCDSENVITLKVEGRGLNGSIPESVGNLTGLTELRLDDNKLGGSIPEFLGKLTSLDRLYLNKNYLTGSIPESLGNLTSLLLLRLSTNQFTGTIPESLSNLKKLTILYLDDNSLTGSIPESLGNLTSLLLLSLSNNQLGGSIPASLGNLKNLTDLYLENNELSGSIPESLGNPKRLDRLRLNDNYLVGSIPGSLLRRPTAEVFNTTNNCLSGDSIQRDGCPSVPSPGSAPPPPIAPPPSGSTNSAPPLQPPRGATSPVASPGSPPPPPIAPPPSGPTNSAPPLQPPQGATSPGRSPLPPPPPFPPPPFRVSPAPSPTKEAPSGSPARASLPGPSPVAPPPRSKVSPAPGPTEGGFLSLSPGITLSGPSPVPPPPPSKVAPTPGPTKVDPLGLGPPAAATSRGNRSLVLAVAVPAAVVSILALVIAGFVCTTSWKKKTAASGRDAPPAPLLQNHTVVVFGGQLTQELQQLPVRSVQNGEQPIQGSTQELQQSPEFSDKYGEELVEGVRCLWEPNPTLPEQFDIVLFPGPKTAWSTRDGSVPCWPMEWLPEEFPNARLLMVEFPKGLSLWESAINHAQALRRDNVRFGKRPYFLVGHSVGGVLAKELLLRTDSDNQEELNMCKGVVFYGVPQLDESPVKSALFGIPESEMGQFDRNESLKRYLDFQALQGKFPTCCFIESMATTIRGRKMMVSANSQVINANASTVGFVEDADHFQVCMPKTKKDLIVYRLVDFIKSWNVPRR